RSANRIETSRRSAVGCSRRDRAGRNGWAARSAASAKGVPHSPQNFAAGLLGVPHAGQRRASAEPHSRQNLRPASFSVPHTEQRKAPPYRYVPGRRVLGGGGAV